MFCKNCGKEISEDVRFCPNCGCDLTGSQPAGNGGQPRDMHRGQTKPPTHLVLAIIVTIFCCLPFGILSIIYSTKVDSYWLAGNVNEAWAYSRKAWNWALVGLVLSVVWWIVYMIMFFLGMSWTTWWADDMYYTTCML